MWIKTQNNKYIDPAKVIGIHVGHYSNINHEDRFEVQVEFDHCSYFSVGEFKTEVVAQNYCDKLAAEMFPTAKLYKTANGSYIDLADVIAIEAVHVPHKDKFISMCILSAGTHFDVGLFDTQDAAQEYCDFIARLVARNRI